MYARGRLLSIVGLNDRRNPDFYGFHALAFPTSVAVFNPRLFNSWTPGSDAKKVTGNYEVMIRNGLNNNPKNKVTIRKGHKFTFPAKNLYATAEGICVFLLRIADTNTLQEVLDTNRSILGCHPLLACIPSWMVCEEVHSLERVEKCPLSVYSVGFRPAFYVIEDIGPGDELSLFTRMRIYHQLQVTVIILLNPLTLGEEHIFFDLCVASNSLFLQLYCRKLS